MIGKAAQFEQLFYLTNVSKIGLNYLYYKNIKFVTIIFVMGNILLIYEF